MANVRIDLDRAGVRELLRSDDMMGVISAEAEAVANRAGAGYETTRRTGKNRAIIRVSATSGEAMKDNIENNTLLKAVGG